MLNDHNKFRESENPINYCFVKIVHLRFLDLYLKKRIQILLINSRHALFSMRHLRTREMHGPYFWGLRLSGTRTIQRTTGEQTTTESGQIRHDHGRARSVLFIYF